jgi:uncharacterized protein (TIGR02271 family)
MTKQSRPAFPTGMVQDMDGVRGTGLPPSPHTPGTATQVVVQLENGQQVVVAAAAFVPQPDGRYFLPLRLTALPPVDRTQGIEAGTPLVLPVIEGALDVYTRRVETGKVRITTTGQEQDILVNEPLWREAVDITRVPRQRGVDGPIPVRTEGDTTIISLVEEVVMVEKRLMLTEELHIRTLPHTRNHRRSRTMAKILVGLYETVAEAEQVVQDLASHGFSRSDIQLVTERVTHAAGRATDQAAASADLVRSGGTALLEELTEYGVPTDEAAVYAEGVRRGGTLVVVDARDDWAEQGLEIMQRRHAVDIDERVAQWRQEGWTHTASSAAAQTTTPERREPPRAQQGGADAAERTIPVVEEEVTVGKREVQRGRVRIHSRVVERPVEESVRLRDETVTVERRPVDRPATEADLAAARDKTLEVTEVDEEAVVSKQARVVEEVVVRKDAEEHTETVRETVRRTEVEVDRDAEATAGTPRPAMARDFASYEADWRQHHGATFLNRGAYADYEPAYRYGYELAGDARYRGRDWAALEADARRDWESRHAGTWEQFKDAIRYGWDKVRART